jgi:hypothetical protein
VTEGIRRPLLNPEQHRKLSRFWTRQKAEVQQSATRVTRAEMGAVMHPNGQLRTVASRVEGDVTGVMLSTLVTAIRGILVSTTRPTDKQVLVYDAALGRLVYNAVTSLPHWEPVTNGDATSPEILFEGGDVLMEEVS